jgi:hypothetical protein
MQGSREPLNKSSSESVHGGVANFLGMGVLVSGRPSVFCARPTRAMLANHSILEGDSYELAELLGCENRDFSRGEEDKSGFGMIEVMDRFTLEKYVINRASCKTIFKMKRADI